MSYDSKITRSGRNLGTGWDDPSRMQPIREAAHEHKVRLEIQRNRRRAERRTARGPASCPAYFGKGTESAWISGSY